MTFNGAEIVTEVNESYSTPVGPMNEDVGPATPPSGMDIELQSNQAYSQVEMITFLCVSGILFITQFMALCCVCEYNQLIQWGVGGNV